MSQIKKLLARIRASLRCLFIEDAVPSPLTHSGILHQVIQSNPAGMILVDASQPDLPIVYVNDAFQRTTGYSAGDVIGRNCRFLHGDDRDQPGLDVMRDAIINGSDCMVTLRNYRKDGMMFWNELRISPIADTNGRVIYYVGVQNDVTARKLAEEALERNELRYRQMFEDNQAIKLVIDPLTGRIIEANSAACQFYGYSRDELLSLYIQDINTLPDDVIHQEMQWAHTQKRTFFEFQHRLSSGEIRDVNVFSSPVSTTAGQFLYSIIVDVTAQRQSEARRQQLVDHLRFLNHTVMELVDLHDERSIYTFLGQQLHHLLKEQGIVIINQNSPDGAEFIIQGVYGVDETTLGKVMKLLGYSPIGRAYQSDPEITPLFKLGKLTQYDGGLVELAKRIVPPVVTRQLVKLFGLSDIYLIGLKRDADFYAGVQLYLRNDYQIENTELIEIFVSQVSIALQRVRLIMELREAEHRHRALFEQSNDAVFVLDLEGRHLNANYRAAELLGYATDEIVGLSYQDLVIPEQHPQSHSVISRLLAGEILRPYERIFRHRDGHLIPAEINVELVRDTSGEPRHIQSLVRDITARKKMEKQLRESEARLRAMIEALPDMIFRNRADGTFVDYHTPNSDLLLDIPQEFIGKHISEILPEESALLHMADIQQAIEQGTVVEREVSISTAGQSRRFDMRVVPIGSDEVLTIARDVTEIWQTRQSLEIAHERMEFSVDIARMAWWEMDVLSGRVEFDDRKVLMAGYDPAEFHDATYHTFTDLVHPDDVPSMMQAMRDLIEGRNDIYATDYRLKTADGDWIWFHDRGRMYINENERRVIRGFVLDITERKEAEAREIELRLEKERRYMLTSFVRVAAHEFRTPLATIASSAYLLLRLEDTLRRNEKYEQIQSHVRQITRLVDVLLLMVKLENDDTLKYAPTDLCEIVGVLKKELIAEYGAMPVLHCTCEPELPLVYGDVDDLADALRQVLDNAYRFTPQNGVIQMTLSNVDNAVQLVIQDSGPGITQDELPHIFETFWRQDRAHTTSGFGVGLPIAQKIIERHNGEITVSSEVGQGTCVTIVFPAITDS